MVELNLSVQRLQKMSKTLYGKSKKTVSSKKQAQISPLEISALVQFIPDPAALLGVNRVTLARWIKGESRVPFAAAQLLRLLAGELPRHFGPWQGWKLCANGEIIPAGWGSGFMREELIEIWKLKQEAIRARSLEIENKRLKRDLAFFRREHEEKAPIAFAMALAEVLNE